MDQDDLSLNPGQADIVDGFQVVKAGGDSLRRGFRAPVTRISARAGTLRS